MKFLTLLVITGLMSTYCFAQPETASSAPDSSKKKSTFTIGVTYSNNADYYGQRAAENLPYAAIAATYKHKSGFYLTGMAYKLLKDSGSIVSATNFGAGVNFQLSKKLSADISYNHTLYPSYSPFIQASNPDNASASLTYESWLTTTLNTDYAFGNTTDVFVTAGIGKSITLGSISSKDVISITPSVDIVAGTQHFYQTYVIEKRLRDSVFGVLLPPLIPNPQQGNTTTTTTTTSTTEFNILSYNFKLPLAYNRASYMIQASYQLSVLSNKAESGAGNANSFLSVSFYYQF